MDNLPKPLVLILGIFSITIAVATLPIILFILLDDGSTLVFLARGESVLFKIYGWVGWLCMVVFLIHLFCTSHVKHGKKLLWLFLMLTLTPISIAFYWRAYIWHPDRNFTNAT